RVKHVKPAHERRTVSGRRRPPIRLLDAARRLGSGTKATRTLTDKDLPNDWLRRPSRRTQQLVIGRHGPPAQNLLPFLADDVLDDLLTALPVAGSGWQKDHAYPVLAVVGQIDA